MSQRELLKRYFLNQAKTGRGGPVLRTSRLQRGHGFGSILSSIFKSPLVKTGLKYAAKTGLSTAGDVVSNLIEGQSFKNAAKTGLSRQIEIQKSRAVRKLKNAMTPETHLSSPRAVARKKRKINKKKGFRKNRTDNFGVLRR